MTDLDSVTRDDAVVLKYVPDSITIGADHRHGEVHLPPEAAPIQSATVVHLLTSERIGNRLWGAGFETHHPDEIITYDCWSIKLRGGGDGAYAYSVLFANNVDEQYHDDIESHYSGDCPVVTDHSY